MISISNQLVGAKEGSKVTLECLSEAYPRSINYWTKENGEIVPQGRYEGAVSFAVAKEWRVRDLLNG